VGPSPSSGSSFDKHTMTLGAHDEAKIKRAPREGAALVLLSTASKGY